MTRLKTFIIFVLLGFALVVCDRSKTGPGAAETPAPAFDSAGNVEAWVKMWNTYDLSQVDKLFVQDDRLTYFSSEREGAIVGIEAVREHHTDFGFVEGGKSQGNRLWVEDLHATDLGSAAIVTGIWYFQRPAGPRQRGPLTFVYVRVGEEFRLVHLNFGSYLDE